MSLIISFYNKILIHLDTCPWDERVHIFLEGNKKVLVFEPEIITRSIRTMMDICKNDRFLLALLEEHDLSYGLAPKHIPAYNLVAEEEAYEKLCSVVGNDEDFWGDDERDSFGIFIDFGEGSDVVNWIINKGIECLKVH